MAEHFPLSLDSGDNQSVDGDKTDSRHADFFPEMKWPEWLDRDLGRGESYSPSTHATVSGSVEARSGYTVDKGLDRSWMQLDAKPLQQCWEHGFWAEIFGEPNSGSASSLVSTMELYRPPVPLNRGPDDEVETGEIMCPAPAKRKRAATYMDVVSQCTAQTWQEQRDSMWEVAVRRWHSSIMTWVGEDTVIGLIQSKPDFRAQCQIIVDILHNKAPSTLLKRCNSISRLVNDLQKNQIDFPCTENDLYEYMCKQRDAGAPHSRMKSLLESVTFVRHVFGVTALEPCTKSRRCMGVATPKTPDITKQAPPLQVDHLLVLHNIIETDDDAWNVAFVGMVLFCTYGRARWSDAQHSRFVEWDMDSSGQICYVECATAVHKTCRALNMKHAFLPLTAPGFGISKVNWASFWRQARSDLGIEDLNEFPLMPAPCEQGTATVRPLSTQEAGKWLMLLLSQNGVESKLAKPLHYTSHSFKATTLSYLAKYGCSFEDRLALGYHVDQVRMALRYSRDGASRPLRVLESCLADIRSGRFRPDETRSGRFVDVEDSGSRPLPVEAVSSETAKTEVQLDSQAAFGVAEIVEVDSDHATTCSESSSGEEAIVMPKCPNRTLLIPSGVDVWKHIKLKTVHLSLEGYVRVLACGRKITGNYQKGGVDIRFDFIKCKQCFNSSILPHNSNESKS